MEDVKEIKIAIGTDHRGYRLKETLLNITLFEDVAVTWHDVGCFSPDRVDYPIYAKAVCQLVLEKKVDYGVLLCSTGIGVAIAANRYAGIYAGLVWNAGVARLAREHDHCNVLAIPADYVTVDQTRDMLIAWLQASELNGVYTHRVNMIDE